MGSDAAFDDAKQVHAVISEHPERYHAIPIAAAGLGLRQGELFGLRVDDVDFLRQRVLVRQQVGIVGSRPTVAPPGFTLRVYAHLMPEPEERARTVVDMSLRSAIGEGSQGAADALSGKG